MNMGLVDRIFRIILGVIAAVIALVINLQVLQIILLVIAGIMLITAVLGFSPLYAIFHMNTKHRDR
jgi:zinc transporter ZupT